MSGSTLAIVRVRLCGGRCERRGTRWLGGTAGRAGWLQAAFPPHQAATAVVDAFPPHHRD